MNELIRVAQLPVIEEHLRSMKEAVDRRVDEALSLVCTEETVQAVKGVRSDLNKEFQTLEEQRKEVKRAVLGPYEQFEAVYKEYVSNAYKRADAALKGKVDDTEREIKQRCEDGLREYFAELCAAERIDFARFEQSGVKVDMASAKQKTPKKLREQLADFVAGIARSVEVISGMDDAEEIMVEFKRTLDAPVAISTVQERHRRIEAEKEAQALREAQRAREAEAVARVEAVAPPAIEPPAESEKVYRCSFSVVATKAQLKKLKDFMIQEESDMNNAVATQAQRPRFSVMISTPGYQKMINSTLRDPKKAQRFVASITSAVATNPALQECDPATVLSGALLGESLNLSPSPQLGQYYLAPFNNTKKGCKDAQFQLGYKGYIQLALRSGYYKHLNVIAVKDGELIHFDPLTEEVEININPDELARESAPTVGYLAMFEYLNGFRKTIYWSREKMEAHALRYSKGYAAKKGYTFWEKDFDAMAFKTMLRQLISKWGVMSIDLQTAFEADAVVEEDGDYLQTPAEELPEVVRSEPQESGAGETIGNPGDEQVKLNDL